MKKIVETDQVPRAIGPYSQAVSIDDLVFTAGQIALSPVTNEMVDGDVAKQTRQVLDNLKAVLEAAGTNLSKVVKTTVYLTIPEHFAPMNDVYGQYFTEEPPARVAIFVKSLPKGALVEIDAIARL